MPRSENETERRKQEYMHQVQRIFSPMDPEYSALWREIAANFYGRGSAAPERRSVVRRFLAMLRPEAFRWFHMREKR